MQNEWDAKLDFLKAIRSGWCNADYFEFLVERVWKIRSAVDMVDFGCGFGFMGMLLLPLLPRGSTYTGIDLSEKLLDEARRIYVDSPYQAQFVRSDLTTYIPTRKYDLATSQAVLRHIPDSKSMVARMADSVKEGGLVVCMETDRLIEEAGRYFSGIDYVELHQIELCMKLWKHEIDCGGRDYRTGLKIPQYMQASGLKDIQIRVNDSVKFANPYADDYDDIYKSMAGAYGWDSIADDKEKEGYADALTGKGLTPAEAEKYVDNRAKIAESVRAGYGKDFIISMPCTPIVFGRK